MPTTREEALCETSPPQAIQGSLPVSEGVHPTEEASILSTLITANHILHYHKVVDAYGHVSVRNPSDPTTFFLSGSLAPALVSAPEDLVEYHISDASSVQSNPAKGYAERFIHSEIYKRYPDVNSVIHAHSEDVLPYAILRSSGRLRPVFHMGGVMGADVPVFDVSAHYTAGDRPDLLVNNTRFGAGLAARMTKPQSVFRKDLVTAVCDALYGTHTPGSPEDFPASPTVLMRNHGFTCVGRGIEEAVYRAVYTTTNARVQTASALIGVPYAQSSNDVWWDRCINYLSEEECRGSWETLQGGADRPWRLWCREVEVSPLYKNELRLPPGA